MTHDLWEELGGAFTGGSLFVPHLQLYHRGCLFWCTCSTHALALNTEAMQNVREFSMNLTNAATSGNPFYVSVAILKLCFSYWCDQVFKSSGHFVAMIQRLTVLVPHRLLISNSVQRQESRDEGSELTLSVYCLYTYLILDQGKIVIV